MIPWFEEAFSIWEMPVSWIECISVLAGIVAVYLAAKENILTWPIGLVNIATAFFIYYHVHLYSDMFLQIYFFGISLYGWWIWNTEHRAEVPLKWLNRRQRLQQCALLVVCSLLAGWWMTRIHLDFPKAFPHPAAFPYADTLVAIGSILANTLMAKRYLESWILWIAIDVLCVYLYLQKDILLIAMEFLIFLILAIYGFWNWMRLKKKQDRGSKVFHGLHQVP